MRHASPSIFGLATAVMILEVALTRVFSFITYHHMTYLVIGSAMLGFGAAGTYLTVRDPFADPQTARAVFARHAALFGGVTIVALFAVVQIPFFPMDLYRMGDARNLLALVPIILMSAGPFFFAGVCIAYLISSAGRRVHRVYFADLLGSGAGALIAIVLVNHAGAVAACFIAAAIAVWVAAAVAPRRRALYAALGIAVAVFAPFSESRSILPLDVPPGKPLYERESSIETVRWHVITRLDVGGPAPCACSFGGALSPRYDGPEPLARLIFQDGANLTGIVHPTPTPEETPVFGYYLQGAAYRIRRDANALVIGAGGGIDVAIALHGGARHVVAVDVNPKMVDLLKNDYTEFSGHLYAREDVEPVVAEGRHFLSATPKQFDVIQLSGVDTWAALASGAYALTENFIYTAEAFDRYLAHLTPDGIVGFSRPRVEPPMETLKLSATALEALKRAGAEDPARHLFIASGFGLASEAPWAQLLIKKSPFTREETEILRSWVGRLGFTVIYDPYASGPYPEETLIRASDAKRRFILDRYPLSLTPATDDVPFYFQYHRWRDLLERPFGIPAPMAMWVLAASLVEVSLLSALLILYPLRKRRIEARRGRFGIFVYFASLGLGFILVEIALLQKLMVFLGGPAYAMAITLATLLVASGFGSLLSERISGPPRRAIGRVIPVVAACIAVLALGLDAMMTHLLFLPLAGRAVAAASCLVPLGLAMGVPFPAGLRHVEAHEASLVPWAWGINACATVVGTSACMILSTAWGLRAALLLGALVYLTGWAALSLSSTRAAAPAIAGEPQRA